MSIIQNVNKQNDRLPKTNPRWLELEPTVTVGAGWVAMTEPALVGGPWLALTSAHVFGWFLIVFTQNLWPRFWSERFSRKQVMSFFGSCPRKILRKMVFFHRSFCCPFWSATSTVGAPRSGGRRLGLLPGPHVWLKATGIQKPKAWIVFQNNIYWFWRSSMNAFKKKSRWLLTKTIWSHETKKIWRFSIGCFVCFFFMSEAMVRPRASPSPKVAAFFCNQKLVEMVNQNDIWRFEHTFLFDF